MSVAKGFVDAVGPNRFFGEARVAGYRDGLTPAQAARTEAERGRGMQRLGYLEDDY